MEVQEPLAAGSGSDADAPQLGPPRAPGRNWKRAAAVLAGASGLCLCLLLASGRSSLRRSDLGASTVLQGQAPASGQRVGSFLVLGDWGYDLRVHGNLKGLACQQAIANKMLETMRSLGDVKFIINVGDSFYPHGVTSKWDPQWTGKWRQIFPKEVRSVPWYSVYGNHDYQHDPCACTQEPGKCAQVNANVSNLDSFYMPSWNWFKEHPELGLEVVALDLNEYMWAWNHEAPADKRCPTDCFFSPCQAACEGNLRARAKEALELFHTRASASNARNLLVFSHYPTDYFWSLPGFLDGLRDASKHHIEYYGGHRHNVDQTSTISTAPNNNWLVGGGGGWGCDKPKDGPNQQGFVVGEIGTDFQISTYSVLVDSAICCKPPPPPGPPPPPPPPGREPTCVLPPQ